MKKVVSILLCIIACLSMCSCGGKDKIAKEVAKELEGQWGWQSLVGPCVETFKNASGNAGQCEFVGANHTIGTYSVYMEDEENGYVETTSQGDVDESGNITKKDKPITGVAYYFTYKDGKLSLYNSKNHSDPLVRIE